jgi:Tol biopolymer transport system component
MLGAREGKELKFYALDPVKGKGRELASVTLESESVFHSWALSPDGSLIAVAMGGEDHDHIHLISLTGGPGRDVSVPGWKRPPVGQLYWSPDGKGWYVPSVSQGGTDLLRIDTMGHFVVLRHQAGMVETWAIPSPDGRHLAFREQTSTSNVWMIEDF